MAVVQAQPGTPPAERPRRWPSTATWVLAAGPSAAVVAVVVSLATGATAAATTVPAWAVWAAAVALALGVPHGAVDARELAGTRQRPRTAALYLGTAAVAATLVLAAPAPAFLAVVAMSAWHFGTGDVESAAELDHDEPTSAMWRRVHALAVGGVPVVLPLSATATTATLGLLEPALLGPLGSTIGSLARTLILLVTAAAAVHLLRTRRMRAVLELLVLLTLALCVTPLLAFAVYFAFWHALRHTARLALDDHGGLTPPALFRVVRAGLPALAVTVLVAVALVAFVGEGTTGRILWIALAIVWGLTVPHMAAVARFDRQRRRARAARIAVRQRD